MQRARGGLLEFISIQRRLRPAISMTSISRSDNAIVKPAASLSLESQPRNAIVHPRLAAIANPAAAARTQKDVRTPTRTLGKRRRQRLENGEDFDFSSA